MAPALAGRASDLLRHGVDPRRAEIIAEAPPPSPLHLDGYLDCGRSLLGQSARGP